MLAKPLLRHILDDALTRGLGDQEARILVEWLVDQAERLDDGERSAAEVESAVRRLCRRARAVGRFVALWCHHRQFAAALQLAGAERFAWPLPSAEVEPDELMHGILRWEDRNPSAR
jgi:hypothetical protein